MPIQLAVKKSSARTNVTKNTVLRHTLREKTAIIHERLHQHAGFHALQLGQMDLKSYRHLLRRLYGFYLPYETAVQAAPERSDWLRRDLASLGLPSQASLAISHCEHMPVLNSAERRLGALYVVEGSMLGGRALALRLDGICGVGVADGRRFFQGRGGGTGEAWSGILNQLNDFDGDEATLAAVVDAALETFACFEQWMTGWDTVLNG